MHRRTLIASTAALMPLGLSSRTGFRADDRSGKHALHGPEAGSRGDPAAAGRRAEACRADQDAGARKASTTARRSIA